MPAQKTQSKKQPPSEIIRVLVTLKEAVRELSRLHRQGRTTELLQGIQELVTKLDSTADIDSNFLLQLFNVQKIRLNATFFQVIGKGSKPSSVHFSTPSKRYNT
jgi:hypothetical protein